MSTVNPYEYPDPVYRPSKYEPGYFQPVQEFDLFRAIQAPFKSPNWVMNGLCVLVCTFLSMFVVGSIVLFGYLAEVVDSRSGGKSENWADFSVDRIGEYLLRGLWGFLWHLIWSIPIFLISLVPILIVLGLVEASSNGPQPSATLLGAGIGFSLFALMGIFVLSLIALISMVVATLGNDFLKGANLSLLFGILGKMWPTILYAGILTILTSMALNVIGTIMCGIGLLFTIPWLHMICADILAQLHDIYVSRGGESLIANHHDMV
jgi:hypothetical protein